MLSSEIVAETWNSLREKHGSSWDFNTLRDADIAFSGLQTAAEQGQLTSAAILDVWENLRGSLGNDILTFLAIDAVFDQLYFLAYEQEIQTKLGDERFQALQNLRSMHFTHRELSELVSKGLLSQSSKNEPAHAPMSGRVIRHYFELFFEGKQLWQQITEMDTSEDIMIAAGSWEVTPEMVQDRMGSLNQEKVEQAANLIRQIIGE